MLNIHTTTSEENGSRQERAFWIDLFDPTPDEIARVGAQTGIDIPSRESLQEIETSSRLRAQGQALYVSMPLANQDDACGFVPVPLGFIVTPQLLITVRFSTIHAFTQLQRRVEAGQLAGGAPVFVALIEGMVDFGADVLEKLSSDLAALSARSFAPPAASLSPAKNGGHALRKCLNAVGIAGDHLSRSRQSLLGLQRIIGFVLQSADDWLLPDLKTRLGSARQDIVSLVDFEAHLSAKTQFLLDAILGFINTEQNDIFRVLTIVSVVGIPPTLIASMYGMNFHHMPELSWRWGYPYGLALIALSALLPILWFKRRGWW
ncbi:MAG: magnesium/cobalt transporter CorA [Steroidobacteraceae bacterium]